MQAVDYLKIELDYDRPTFNFPDLSSPDGNPREYFRLAIDELRKNGFRKEAIELDQLKLPRYEESFDLIYRFLDFKEPSLQLPFKEDDEYVYFRVKKDQSKTKQLDIFKVKSLEDITELISDGHDFSVTNCYNRNHLHYLDNLSAIKELLKANRDNQWFSLFDLDVFNSTILHGYRKPEVFTYLLSEISNDDKDIAKMLLFGTNVFGKNAFGEILNVFSSYFYKTNPTVEQLCSLKDFLKVLGNVDVEKRDEFINLLDNLSGTNHDNKKYGTVIMTEILTEELVNDNKNTSYTKKIKI